MSKFASIATAAAVAVVGVVTSAAQAVVVGVPTGAPPMIGFMNVFERPENGGGYAFGSGWGVPDLKITFAGSIARIEATPIGTGDAFWYQNGTGGPGALGNKVMEANGYVQDDALAGQVVTFTGDVIENTLVPGYTSMAFIKDFAPDFSSSVTTTVPLTPGVFSLTLDTIDDPARHVQYGFMTTGLNVWPTDVAGKGFVTVQNVVPEPATTAAVAAAAGLVMRRRR